MNKPLFRYIAALLLFGSNGIIASLIGLSSYEIVMFRTLIGSALLITIYLLTEKHLHFYRYKKSFLFLALSGISMGVSWLFLYEAYRQIGVSIASLGYYCGPVIVMAVSPFLFGERFTGRKSICFLIVFVGIVLVNGNVLQEQHNGIGIFFALMSAVMYACMVSFNKKATEITGLENATLQLLIAFLSVFVFVLFKQGLHFRIEPSDLLPLIFLGLVNTGLGCFLYFSSIGSIRVQTVAILGYLEPLSAVAFSVLFLKEHLTGLQGLGAICIILGAVFAESVPISKRR